MSGVCVQRYRYTAIFICSNKLKARASSIESPPFSIHQGQFFQVYQKEPYLLFRFHLILTFFFLLGFSIHSTVPICFQNH